MTLLSRTRALGGVLFKTILLLLILFVMAAPRDAIAKDSVRLGQVVATDAAILCLDPEPAKYLADLTKEEEIQVAGQEFITAGLCGIAAGKMSIESLVYEGKTYNVFKTRDTSREYYWVTVVKPEYD